MTTWTAEDKFLVTAISDSSLLVWDTVTCNLLYRLKGHKVIFFYFNHINSVFWCRKRMNNPAGTSMKCIIA